MNDSKNNTLKEIGLRFQEARKACGLTQEQAAEISDTTQQNISAAERGDYYLSSDIVYRLCVRYGISVEYLMTGVLSDSDILHNDPRTAYLTPEQIIQYKVIIDAFFASHGITNVKQDEDSR